MRAARFVLAESLYANSLWLLLGQGFNIFFGFLFWLVVARLYAPSDVGIGAALLPAAGMMGFISMLGLGPTLIRFIASAGHDNPELVNQVFTVVTIAALLLATLFVFGFDLWSPKLSFVRNHPLYLGMFVALVVLSAVFVLFGEAFVAVRRTNYALAASLIHGLGRVAGAAVFSSLIGGPGIVLAWTLAMALAVCLSAFVLFPRALPGFRLRPQVRLHLFHEIGGYSLASYVADGLWSVPSWVLPLIFVNLLGPEQNAYFGITWVVAMLPLTVPQAIARAMFSEGSHHPDRIGEYLLRSIKLAIGLLGPVLLGLLFLGEKLLSIYGAPYADAGHSLLTTAALAVVPGTLTVLYIAIARVRKQLVQIILTSGGVAVGTLLITFVLVGRLGILAAGVGFLATHTLIAVVLLPHMVQLVRATAEQQATVSHRADTD